MGSLGSSKVVNQWFNFCLKSPHIRHFRPFSSKTPVNASLPVTVSEPEQHVEVITPQQSPPVPYFSGEDIRQMSPELRDRIHNASMVVAKSQASGILSNKRMRRRKEILIMEPEEYKDKAILQKKPPLLDRRGEAESYFFRSIAPDNFNNIDLMCKIQADIDLRPEAVKSWWAKKGVEHEIDEQKFNPKRSKTLGSDLAAAHVVVARGGKVKFMGQKNWVTTYRKDAKPGVDEDDLPAMRYELCTLPVKFDPGYRLEAIDASKVELYYEGLENFEDLQYVKWLSLRDCPHIDDWCLDRIARQLEGTLEYIDLSGCKKVTDKGIGTLHRCKKLKRILVENMGHLEHLEIVSALLEDNNPSMQVIGIDYEAKTEQLRLEAIELEERAQLARQETNAKQLSAASESQEISQNLHAQVTN